MTPTPGPGHLWLVGMMGSGKTTVGALVAAGAGTRFMDTDRMVEEATTLSIATLWEIDGGTTFRQAEAAAVTAAAADPEPTVVAAGGGAVLDPGNVDHMRTSGMVVWLEAEPAELTARVAGHTHRPLLAGADPEGRLVALLADRHAAYAAAAHHRVATGGRTPGEVADVLGELWAGT